MVKPGKHCGSTLRFALQRCAPLNHRLSVPRLRTVFIVPGAETNVPGAFPLPCPAPLRSALHCGASPRVAALTHRCRSTIKTFLIVPVSETNVSGAFPSLRPATLRIALPRFAHPSLPIHDQDRSSSFQGLKPMSLERSQRFASPRNATHRDASLRSPIVRR